MTRIHRHIIDPAFELALITGEGDPSAAISAATGSLYVRRDGVAGNVLWQKYGSGWELLTAASSGVTGSGTTGAIAKFTATATIGNSVISEDATYVTITGRQLVVGQAVFSTGANAGYYLDDAVNGSGHRWALYSSSNVLRLYSVGATADRMYVYENGDVAALRHLILYTNATFLQGRTSGGTLVSLLGVTNDTNNYLRFRAAVDAGGFQWTDQAASVQWAALTASLLTVPAITSTANGTVLTRTGATTGAQTIRLANTGGDFYFGVESSSAGSFFTGSDVAYAAVLYATTPIELIVSGTLALKVASSGVTAGVLTLSGAGPNVLTFSNNATLGQQVAMGSTIYGAFGTAYSSGGAFVAYNASQPTSNTDSWSQSNAGVKSLLFIGDGTNGFRWFQANTSRTTGNLATFWGSALMTLTTAGALSVTSTMTATDFVLSSDRRLKHDLRRLEHAMTALHHIPAYSYHRAGTQQREYGVIAQDVARVYPHAVHTGLNGYLGVAYDRLVPLAITALQELDERLTRLELRLAE